MVTSRRTTRRKYLPLLYMVICVVGLYGIIPQLSDFHHSLGLVGHASLLTLLAVFLSCALTYLLGAANYLLLAFKPLRFGRTTLVEFASMFMNRLLPAGIGTIGTNYAYLRKQSMTVQEASAAVAANNGLGYIGHLLLLAMVFVFAPHELQGLRLPHVSTTEVTIVGSIVSIIVIVVVPLLKLQKRIARALKTFFQQLGQYRTRPLRVLATLLSSMCLTLATVLSLWFAMHGVGIHLSFLAAFLIFTFGLGLGTVTPTPGGIGGIEAGLVGGLVAYHVVAATALAAVLLYRLISYWLMLLIGALAFIVVRRRHYL